MYVCVLGRSLNRHKVGRKANVTLSAGKAPEPNGLLIFPHLPQSLVAVGHT